MFCFEKALTGACVLTAAVCFGVTWKFLRSRNSMEAEDHYRLLEKQLERLRKLAEHGFTTEDDLRLMEEIERILKEHEEMR